MSLAGPNRKPALTAAASKIAFSRVYADTLKEEDWQVRAWGVYDKLPSVFYMTRYRSDIASKMDYFVGTIQDPSQDPEADDGAGSKVLENEGGPDLLRRIVSEFVVHWDIPGEGYLTRFEEAPYWRVLSTQELKKQGQGSFMWGDADNNLGSIDGDNVYRVWDSHPRFHWQADSPVRHILEEAEELILLSRAAKVQSMSQVSAGVLILPDSIDMSPFAEDTEGTEDDVARWLIQVLAKPISDPGSTASITPAVMTMNGDDIAKVRHLTFERDWQVNLELRRELLAAVATGLDLPPEILTGMADLNHWSAWLVSEQAVNQHVLPSVDAILDSLTQNWFRPLLEASGVNPEGYVLWRDPSPATVPPDQTDVAARAFELGAISGEAYRRVINMDEEDAPTPEEVAARTPKPPTEDQPRNDNGPPVRGSLEDGDPPLPGAAVTAAARRRIVATELADLDAELLAWVVEQSDKEIDRLLNLALTAANDPIDETLLEPLASRLERRIGQAQGAVHGWLTQILGRSPSTDGQAVARKQGVQVIIAGIVEAVRRKLFTPDAQPDPIDLGRMPNITTPTEAIRNGLSLAGGGPAVYEDGNASELIGNGQTVKEELAGDGFFVDGYEWKYGNPTNTFEPHLNLDGVRFTSWEDPRLRVGFNDSWLRRSYYRPGDHRGCQCAFVQVIIQELPLEDERASQADLRKLNEERLAKYDLNPRPGIDDNPEIVAAAKDKFEHIMGRERSISKFLDPMAESTGGQFQHYGERVKLEASLRDKIWREQQADPTLSVSQAAERVTDGNRYTLMWEADDQFRLRHQQTVRSFNDSGWETISDKNAWAPGDAYDGMNYKFKKGDDIVEVQFHTPRSAVIKDESHVLYSRARIMPPGPERDRLRAEIIDLWNADRAHIPPNMVDVGTQTWYDLDI